MKDREKEIKYLIYLKSQVCKGKRKQAGGYIWKYLEECNGNN